MSHLLRCRLGVLALLLLAIVSGADGARAAAPDSILLWPAGAPGESGDVGKDQEKQEPLRPGDSTIRTTNITRPSITVYRPEPTKANGTAVLICPGGGYRILAFNKEGTEVAEWLRSLGVTAFVLKYRVPAHEGRLRHDAPLQDAQRAIRLIRQRATEWQVDPDRIGVLGFSAGGHLAALLSTNAVPPTAPPGGDLDRVSSRPNFSILIYPAYLATKDDKLAPPIQVDAKTPPTFLVQTEDDSVRVESSLVYYLALKRASVPAEMHVYPRGGHGYGLRPSENLVSTWPLRAEEWLKSSGYLKSSHQAKVLRMNNLYDSRVFVGWASPTTTGRWAMPTLQITPCEIVNW